MRIIPQNTPKVTKKLIAAKRLIDKPEKWAQFHIRDSSGRYCTSGAIYYSALENYEEAMTVFMDANCLDSIPKWNDSPHRSHSDVMKAFDKAIEYSLPKRK